MDLLRTLTGTGWLKMVRCAILDPILCSEPKLNGNANYIEVWFTLLSTHCAVSILINLFTGWRRLRTSLVTNYIRDVVPKFLHLSIRKMRLNLILGLLVSLSTLHLRWDACATLCASGDQIDWCVCVYALFKRNPGAHCFLMADVSPEQTVWKALPRTWEQYSLERRCRRQEVNGRTQKVLQLATGEKWRFCLISSSRCFEHCATTAKQREQQSTLFSLNEYRRLILFIATHDIVFGTMFDTQHHMQDTTKRKELLAQMESILKMQRNLSKNQAAKCSVLDAQLETVLAELEKQRSWLSKLC